MKQPSFDFIFSSSLLGEDFYKGKIKEIAGRLANGNTDLSETTRFLSNDGPNDEPNDGPQPSETQLSMAMVPNEALFHLRLGNLFYHLAKYEEAVREYEEAITI